MPGFIASSWPGMQRPARHLDAADLDRVVVGAQLDVVADADRGERQAELGGHLAAHHARRGRAGRRPRRRRRAGPGRSRSPARAGRAAAAPRRSRAPAGRVATAVRLLGGLLLGLLGDAALQQRRDQEDEAADDEERAASAGPGRAPARRRTPARYSARGWRATCLARSWPRFDSPTRAGDDDAGGGGDQQRRDLRDQALADGEQREVLERLAEAACPAGSTPTTMPPMRLIITMITPAMASPFTNFEAPSIAP